MRVQRFRLEPGRDIKEVFLLAVQGTLKSILQHHSSKASILRRSAFCIALGNPCSIFRLYEFASSRYFIIYVESNSIFLLWLFSLRAVN